MKWNITQDGAFHLVFSLLFNSFYLPYFLIKRLHIIFRERGRGHQTTPKWGSWLVVE